MKRNTRLWFRFKTGNYIICLLSLLISLSLSNSLFAQTSIPDPIQWKLQSLKNESGIYELSFTAQIEQGWYIYAQDIAKNGPIPTSIEFQENQHVQFLQEKLTEKSNNVKEGHDQFYDMPIKKFSSQVVYSTQVKTNVDTVKLAGTVGFMTCNDHQCLPPDYIDFEFDLKGNQSFKLELIEATPLSPNDLNQHAKHSISAVDIDNPINNCGEEKQSKGIWSIFILGFLGGLLALLTPCVFPMIPLTVSYFTKGSGNRSKGIFRAVLYGFFIFLIYLLFSLPFHIFDSIAPDIFHQISTSVYLNIAFFIIFVIFALSFFGFFEMTLPSSIANKADAASEIGGMVGIFFMAFTLAIVSFSCTGPILGSLLAGTLSADGGAMQLTAGMSGFGLALGIPFAIFALFPGMLGSLPKSGGWLNTVKVVLGFVELALAIKFLSNADLVKNWGFLPREIFFALWILIGLALTAYLFGFIKFPHDSPIKKLSFTRIGLGVLSIAFVVYLIPGLTNSKYANRELLSGFPPPLFYSLYETVSTCPLNLDCYKDYEQGVAYAKKVNKPILLDFTGWACVSCRKMEETVWVKPEIFNKLNEEFVLISLYVDDQRELPANEIYDYAYPTTGKKRRVDTRGEVWSVLQTETFKTSAQPYYALLSPDEELLNPPVGYEPNVKEYSRFLDCGLDAFAHAKAK